MSYNAMMIGFYIAVFTASLLFVVLLFSFSYAEARFERRFAPSVRNRFDAFALSVRRTLKRIAHIIEHLPVYSLRALYLLLHLFAVAVALAARAIEAWARSLSDAVSYRRGFKQKPTKSSFLRQVRHHKETLQVPEEVWKDDREA